MIHILRAAHPKDLPFSRVLVLVALVATLLHPTSALAERAMDPSFEISVLGGVGFGGQFEVATPPAEFTFQASPLIDGMIAMRPYSDEGRLIIVSYTYQWAEVRVRPAAGGPSLIGDLGIGFLHAGGEVDGRMTKWIHPFFGLTLGATQYTSHEAGFTSWFFSGGAHGGLKVPFGDHVGLRFQGRYIGTLINSDRQLLCTSGSGGQCVLTLSDAVGAHQGEFSGGVYFRF